jgi:TolA-binding protein
MAKRYISRRGIVSCFRTDRDRTPRGTGTSCTQGNKVMNRRISNGFIIVILTVTAIALFTHSCAYFNTLYNARRIYNEAELQREEQGADRALKDKYEEVVKKCANLVASYPNSRWVDDALFLMGKALVRQGELNKGIRKFIELRANFPESKYVAPALYWLALAYFEKKDYTLAIESAERFLERYPDHELRHRVMFLAGDIHLELENTEEALNFYSMVAERASRREVVDEAVLKSAELFYKKEMWEEAAANYEKALRKGLPWEQRYRISLSLGECYTKTGKCTEAMEIFDKLLGEIITSKEKPPLMLGRASSFECMDSTDAAIAAYEDVTKDFPRSSYSAESYFRLGVIYHEKMDSLVRAQEAYSKVAGEYANSEFASLAVQKSGSLKRLIELQKSEGEGETREQAAQKRFLTAEIQLMRLNEIDLAISNYSAVVDSFSDTGAAPRSAYALAWIHHYKLADTIGAVERYREVVTRFPHSPQAKGAVIELGNLGEAELRGRLTAYIDSALADSAAARAEELERMRELQADSAAIDTMSVPGAGAVGQDTTGVFIPGTGEPVVPQAPVPVILESDTAAVRGPDVPRDSVRSSLEHAVPDTAAAGPQGTGKSADRDSVTVEPRGAARDSTLAPPETENRPSAEDTITPLIEEKTPPSGILREDSKEHNRS